MRVNVKTTNFDITPSVEALAEGKLISPVNKLIAKIDRNTDIVFDIELGRTTKHHRKGKIWRAEVQISLPGLKNMLRAEALAESLEEAVNLAKNEITQEIKKYKEKTRVQG